MTNIVPRLDNVVVLPSNMGGGQTASGLYIPDISKDKPATGVVMAVGPGRYEHGILIVPDLKARDVVLFNKFGATAYTVDGRDYVILKAAEIVAVLK